MNISANFAISLDFKMTTIDGKFLPYRSQYDRDRMDIIRYDADAILVGTNTFINDKPPLYLRNPKLIERRLVNGFKEQPYICILTSNLDLDMVNDILIKNKNNFIFFTQSEIYDDFLEKYHAYGEVISTPCNKNGLSLKYIVEILKNKGFNKVLIECGPKLLSSFLEEDLLTELNITIFPIMIGSGRSISFHSDINGVINSNWRLKEKYISDSEVYLVYDKVY